MSHTVFATFLSFDWWQINMYTHSVADVNVDACVQTFEDLLFKAGARGTQKTDDDGALGRSLQHHWHHTIIVTSVFISLAFDIRTSLSLRIWQYLHSHFPLLTDWLVKYGSSHSTHCRFFGDNIITGLTPPPPTDSIKALKEGCG